MPHLILEHSSNVNEAQPLSELFEKLLPILAEKLPADLGACKCRAVERSIFRVGDGATDNAFVHIDLQVFTGRTEDTLNQVGEAIMDTVKTFFAHAMETLNLQISLKISEIEKFYFVEGKP